MGVNFQLQKTTSSIIKVIGIGGAGCNAVNHMVEEGIAGVDYIVCNTDAQALKNSPVPIKVQIGVTLTHGLGAGNNPKMGEEAAKENFEDILKILKDNTKMLFITAGMGGGTGTGAAPVIAMLARELEREGQRILTIAVVTVPSRAEGKKRFGQAMEGTKKLAEFVDSMLVVSNERLHNIFGNLPARAALKLADNIVATAVKGVAEIITLHGTINIDYADVFTVMADSEVFIMGTGYGSDEGRALKAINKALEFPLLDSNDIKGARNILLKIVSGNEEITIGEIGEIIETLQDLAGQEADIIWGNGYDDSLGNEICVTILATGFANNPNHLLQKKKPQIVYHLEEPEPETIGIYQEDQDESLFKEELTSNTTSFSQKKPMNESQGFSSRRQSGRKKINRKDPAPDSSIDNWFNRMFGISRLLSENSSETVRDFEDV